MNIPKKYKHPTNEYAYKIIKGHIPACRWVRLACKRHIEDLKRRDFCWRFDEALANRAFNFFNECLVLESPNGLESFKLFDWQHFVLGSIYGWVDKDDKRRRRYRECYIEGARGLGKSPFAAGVAILHTFANGIRGAQGFCIARTSEQTNAVFRTIGKFAEHINEVRNAGDQFKIFSQASAPYIIARTKKNQILKKLASDVGGAGKSGYVADFVCADEIHEMKTSAIYDKLKSAMKKDSPTPLMFAITNAGVCTEGPCWVLHEKATSLLDPNNDYDNEREFALIYTLDEGDKPYDDEECWHKANPSLKYGIPSIEFYRDNVKQAKGNPSMEAETDRAFFSKWTSGVSPWISVDDMDKLSTKNPDNKFPSEDELKKMRAYIGLDLSSNVDLTSISICWVSKDNDKKYIRNHSYVPAKGDIAKKERIDKAPYRAWAKDGYVTIIDDGVIPYEDIAEYIKTIQSNYNVAAITLDTYRLHDFIRTCKRVGLDIHKKGDDIKTGTPAVMCWQGRIKPRKDNPDIYMPRCIEIFENSMRIEDIMIDYNPCLVKAAVSSMWISDNQGLRCFNKEKSYARIDPIISVVESVGLADKHGKYMTSNEIGEMWMQTFKNE